jgi:hypothetical protein
MCSISKGRCVAMVMLLVLVSPAYASGPAATPEQLIQFMSAAARQGDSDGFLSYLTTDARNAVQESAASQASLRAAEESFQKALDDRFGKGEPIPVSPPMDLKTAISRVDSFELLDKKPGPAGIVYLRVRTSLKTPQGATAFREDTFAAAQENGAWKLDLNPGKSLDAKAELAALNRTAEALQSGKFTDRHSALLELNQARSTALGAQRPERGIAARQKGTPPPATGAVVTIPPVARPAAR